MKRLTTALLGLLLLTTPLLRAADFEGVVTMAMTGSGGQTTPMTFSIKPGFTRIDMAAGGGRFGGMIMDQKAQQMMIIVPERHMCIVQPIPHEVIAQAQEKIDGADVQKTSDREKVLGYDTTKYVAKTSEGTTEIWVTDQLGTFQGLGPNGRMGMGGGGGAGHAWEKAFKGKNAFPLRVVTTDAGGEKTFTMEATNVQKKSLPDSLFQAPAGFKKLDMGAMMRGMGGMGGMPGMPGGSQDE
jgi:hypothetical protein